jgi:site-specific DNA-methyltransferase (adenine-specific)
MDAVFGKDRFQNEVIWSYRRWPTKARRFQRMHDSILFYSASQEPGTFNVLYQPPTASSMKRWGTAKQKVTFDESGVRNPTLETDEDSEVPLNSVWQLPIIAPVSKERLGYPTQKPVALLERIISASSNPGDVVLDPFCGCGTTVHAAEKLGRQWIGIDITHLSVALIERRLKYAFPGISYRVHGIPKDIEGARDLAARDKHDFQIWAVTRLENAVPGKKGADGGIDGHIFFRSGAKSVEKAIVSVKGGGVGVKDIRELTAVVDRERAKIGVYISLETPTEPMKKEAAGAGLYDNGVGKKVPKIQLVTVEELFAGKKPDIPLMERGFKAAAREERDDQPEFDI